MYSPILNILEQNELKLTKAIQVFVALVDKIPPFDPEKNYTAQELESFDALTSRFLRCYEVSIQYFRTIDSIKSIEKSETFRDLTHQMQKFGLINEPEIWAQMRIIRNKITHDYLPEQLGYMYAQIVGVFASEIVFVIKKNHQNK
jgi:hypothetical protein